jgi:hypothetical protein
MNLISLILWSDQKITVQYTANMPLDVEQRKNDMNDTSSIHNTPPARKRSFFFGSYKRASLLFAVSWYPSKLWTNHISFEKTRHHEPHDSFIQFEIINKRWALMPKKVQASLKVIWIQKGPSEDRMSWSCIVWLQLDQSVPAIFLRLMFTNIGMKNNQYRTKLLVLDDIHSACLQNHRVMLGTSWILSEIAGSCQVHARFMQWHEWGIDFPFKKVPQH